MKRKAFIFWFLSLIFSVGFGELFLSGVVAENPTPFEHFLPIAGYYAVLCFFFSLLVVRVSVVNRMVPKK